MKKSKKAFSLIEIIVATGILTISVFGVFKLISENVKIIHKSDIQSMSYSLHGNLRSCIENIGFDSFYNNTQSGYTFHLGNQGLGCGTGASINTNIDNTIYYFNGEIVSKTDESIHWELTIKNDGTPKSIEQYFQTKK